MGLETTNFITGLNVSWPLAGDLKSQGDDHLRLLKTVLTLTFPTASRPYYFPTVESSTAAMILDATDQNNIIIIDVTAGDVPVTLPSTLTANDKGWQCQIVKNTGPVWNGIVVSPASGLIYSSVGPTTTIRIERYIEPAVFTWTGTTWMCYKPGAPIGSSMNWDITALPPGYRPADGTTYSTTTLAEYAVIRGNGTTPDKRGRVEAGVDGGVGRLSVAYFGAPAVLGAVGGAEATVAGQNHMPPHFHGVSISDPGHAHGVSGGFVGGTSTFSRPQTTVADASIPIGSANIAINAALTGVRCNSGNGLDTTDTRGSGQPLTNVQHTYVTNKLIRVC